MKLPSKTVMRMLLELTSIRSLNKNFKYYFFTESEIIDCLQLSILSLTGVNCGRK